MDGQGGSAFSPHCGTTGVVTMRPFEERHWKVMGIIAAFVLFDLFSIAAPGVLIAWLYLGQVLDRQEFSVTLLLGFVSAILYSMAGAYRTNALTDAKTFTVLRLVVLFCVWSAMLIITFGLKRTEEFSRIWLFSWMFSSSVMIGLTGLTLPMIYRNIPVLSLLKNHYVHIQTQHTINRFIAPFILSGPFIILKRTVSDSMDDALLRVDEEIRSGNNIILSSSVAELNSVMRGISRFRLSGIDMFLDLSVENRTSSGPGSEFSRLPLVHIIRRPMGDFDIALKRLVDISISSLIIFLLLPVLAVISVLILFEDGRPILFWQPRKGYRHGVFEVWKFRTMRAKDSDVGAVRQASHDDGRITQVGRFLRASYLDELPQLFNVLQGKMSLVGPRPHALQMTVDGIPVGELVKEYAKRHNIRPGMTGLAQVRGFRGPVHDLSHLQSRIESDIEYIEHWKLTLDLWIILKTIRIVLSNLLFSKARQGVG